SIAGHAKDISEFVKHGYGLASIEIDLKGHSGHCNPIKWHIQCDSNSSTWKLNGHASTFEEIQETMSLQATTKDKQEKWEAILQQIKIIETWIPFAQYAESKDCFNTIKKEHKTIHQNDKQLQRQYQPHLELKARVAHNIPVAKRPNNSMEDAS
ncbi:hypothetical protein H4R33_007015, partial [Dimargaris cristalligena]